ncbi:MAG TPA: PPC domain-containing protein, partial [Pirellulales bacterium]|nr:PPC domain-containing protein [Pirellulales bacterium]
AGQRIVFDVLAQRLGSALRPVITLFNSSGHELAQQMTASRDIAPDNRLIYTFRESGSYFLRLRDLTYTGADFAVYQLRVGTIPFATAMFPLGGKRGSKTPVTFTGGSLEQPLVYEVDLTQSPLWQITRLQVPLADDLLTAPAWFAAGDLPEALEAEPNDEPSQAQPQNLPISLHGRIDRPGDRDLYRFHAAAGTKITLRVAAQQLGSPVDAVVTISDATGKELLSLDDRQPTPREAPIVRVIETPPVDDPLGEFTATVEGDYLVAVEDRFGNGGPEYGYRLDLAPAESDFDLMVQPADVSAARSQQPQRPGGPVQATYSGIGSGSLSLDRGGAGSFVVRAFRNGYNGPIELSLEGLPEGVHAASASIAGGQNETTVTLTADFAAASTAGMVRVIGLAPAEGAAPERRRLAMQPVVFSALPVNGGLQRSLSEVAVAIGVRGAELAIQASFVGQLVPGGKAKVQLAAQRREGYAGKIEVKFANLPADLTAPAADIAPEQNDAAVEVVAGADLTPGIHRLVVEATMRVDGKQEPVVALFPLDFEVLPLATLELKQQQLDLAVGSSAVVEVNVRRNVADPTPIELVLSGLPKGVTAAATNIERGVEHFELKLTAGAGASASPIRRIVQIKPRLTSGERKADLPTLRFALRLTK